MSEGVDKTRQQYIQELRESEDIRRLRILPEFRAMENLLKEIYREAAETLMRNESLDARSTIKVIDQIFDKMQYNLRLGEDASQWLANNKEQASTA